ncbi:MAG TPA: carboxypeptidase-like regulatory domain-containing protein, partial [Fimbriimonadaceae bacterium]|nr:carboxypeptidase-like regulatory domain-containing protein [Fimbriimonadaceae bacterium]
VSVMLNEDSFEDPTWATAQPGALVIPRPGRIARLDLGVIESAEIEGRAEGVDSGRQALTAELINFEGNVSHTSVLDGDGIYVFSKVRPGDYTLRIVDPSGQSCGKRLVRVAPGAAMKDCDLKLSIPK